MHIWPMGGQYGIWGGCVEADRAAVRSEWLAGVPVTALVKAAPEASGDHLRPDR
jgi:hypothetical protein